MSRRALEKLKSIPGLSAFLRPLLNAYRALRIRQSERRLTRRISNLRKLPGQPALSNGVNLIVFASDPGGVLNVAMMQARQMINSGIPIAILDMGRWPQPLVIPPDLTQFIVDAPKYPTNIWHVGFPFLKEMQKMWIEWFDNRWNINFTHWELPIIPTRLAHHFEAVDSVMVSSDFVGQAIKSTGITKVQLYTLDLRIEESYARAYDRAFFGLPEDKVLFLINWEFTSSTIRKNPEAALKAFSAAFTEDDQARLVCHIKFESRHGEEQRAEYSRYISDLQSRHPNVLVITEPSFSYEQSVGLKRSCDCYVSLHRSEGFGMGCAEALAVKRKCIMTGWSGNMELTKFEHYKDQIFCTGYELVPVKPSDYPWVQKGEEAFQYWAEPSISDAAKYMRQVYEACKSQRTVKELSPRT